MKPALPDTMPLLDEGALLRSETVANAKMNRWRGFTGVNSYTKELRFDIASFLRQRAESQGSALWYDACCGVGRALTEAREQWRNTSWGENIEIVGADLIDDFPSKPLPGLRFFAGDVRQHLPDVPIDLVTIVHGLHYLGDKLGFLEKAYARLRPGGLLIGHLDGKNVRFPDQEATFAQVLGVIKKQGLKATFRNHLLSIEKTDALLNLKAEYVGASVSEGPNFAGIIVIDSWYRVVERG